MVPTLRKNVPRQHRVHPPGRRPRLRMKIRRGQADLVADVEAALSGEYREGLTASEAVQLGRKALDAGSERGSNLNENSLEVCVLDREKAGRKFTRMPVEEVRAMLEG